MLLPIRRLSITVLLLSVFVSACQVLNLGNTKPVVVISSPVSGSEFSVDQDIAITSTSTDPQGITRVELLVDGLSVRTDPSPVAQGQAQFQLIQTWKASGEGTHAITVRAYNTLGAFGEGGISVTIKGETALGPTETVGIATPVPLDTSTPRPSVVATAASPSNTQPAPPPLASCTSNSAYVTDVTIPDGTVLPPGTAFTKTWRVQNNGTCAWNTSYALILVGGAPLASQNAFPVPELTPGAIADISIPMVAPLVTGAYSSIWRVRDSLGAPFGSNFTAVINVASATPPAILTNTPRAPTPTKTTTASNAPAIAYFTCDPCTINPGQSATLSWGLVTRATSATIDPGIGGVATPGHILVTPAATTTYTLKAVGPGGTTQLSLTIVVNTTPGNFDGYWVHNFGDMNLTQTGANVTGTFTNAFEGSGTVSGTVSGNTLTGSWSISGKSGSFSWTLNTGGQTFNGDYDRSSKWCGARAGVVFPNGCSFAGHWNTNLPGVCTGMMNLTQVGTTVTGSYCGGAIDGGVISYTNGFAVLNATWHTSTSGPLQLFLIPTSSTQFQGNWSTTNAWCGWRDGVPAVSDSNCLKN